MNNDEVKRRRLASAGDFQSRGLVMLPMHAVINGVCQGSHEVAPGEWRKGGTCTHKPGKHPAMKWAALRNTGLPNRPEDLAKWVGRDQNLGVLMDCGALRIWVADCDTRDARGHVESILGKTPCVVETGRDGGGWHLYYLLPPGVSMKADNGNSFPGLDIKTSGYVIAPWGRHHSGRYYTPEDGFDLSLAPVVDPHRLKPVQVSSAPSGGKSGSVLSNPAKGTQLLQPRQGPRWYFYGQRNGMMYDLAYRYEMARLWLMEQGGCIQGHGGRKTLFIYACELVRWFLLDEAQTLGLMIEFNRHNNPPFSIPEIVDAVDAAFEIGTWSVRGSLSYAKAKKREKSKSRKSSVRRSEKRADVRNDMWSDLTTFLRNCCGSGDELSVTVTDLWTAFCHFAPWVSNDRGVFGHILHEALVAAFPSNTERKKNRSGYFYEGVGLRADYLSCCSHAA